MMTVDIRRHIDAARQILVGVVPNPTSQIEQITNALIYKFMDDMDQAAIKAGGKPSFFVKDLERYAWTRLMDSKLGNQERMNIYVEALIKFSEAKQLPPLFHEIFKSAFLPYRSPETLGLFLKEIDFFDYSHPEELGNSYEYLLSIMSSQGDAGQFRTPRHIIDFIVDVVNPTKDDKVLDPACGTGGFLVKSYQHILEQHNNKENHKGKDKPLTPDDLKNIMNNFEGYDIDPSMVRIAQVNMYLHKFKNPKIFQYDTLSNEERWADKFDVILANPPFMSPKGGIIPHNKFGVPSSRSEVLFVDYIMSHLRPKGRAGIIVPEGIIFQSGSSYKELRKNLIEDGLYAVVSLPSGVFAPYSGVKTSILFFNNELAKQKKEVLFIKIENDGFDLGATKRQIDKNDIPTAVEILNKWKTGKKVEGKLAIYVEKKKIAEDGDYNLSGDRYRIKTDYTNSKWPIVEIRSVVEVKKERAIINEFPYLEIGDVNIESKNYSFKDKKSVTGSLIAKKNDIVISKVRPTRGAISIIREDKLVVSGGFSILCADTSRINPKYLFFILANNGNFFEYLGNRSKGMTYPTCSDKDVLDFEIPLPPIEIQEKTVEVMIGYKKIIDGVQQTVSNWKPIIDIDPKWEKIKLAEVCDIRAGGTPPTNKSNYYENGDIPWLKSEVCRDEIITEPKTFITKDGLKNSSAKWLSENTTLIALVGATIGKTAFITFKATTNQNVAGLYPKNLNQLNPFYLYLISQTLYDIFIKLGDGGFKMANLSFIKNLEIPLPPIKNQEKIVKDIETQLGAIEQAKNLKRIFDKRIKDVTAKLWEL